MSTGEWSEQAEGGAAGRGPKDEDGAGWGGSGPGGNPQGPMYPCLTLLSAPLYHFETQSAHLWGPHTPVKGTVRNCPYLVPQLDFIGLSLSHPKGGNWGTAPFLDLLPAPKPIQDSLYLQVGNPISTMLGDGAFSAYGDPSSAHGTAWGSLSTTGAAVEILEQHWDGDVPGTQDCSSIISLDPPTDLPVQSAETHWRALTGLLSILPLEPAPEVHRLSASGASGEGVWGRSGSWLETIKHFEQVQYLRGLGGEK